MSSSMPDLNWRGGLLCRSTGGVSCTGWAASPPQWAMISAVGEMTLDAIVTAMNAHTVDGIGIVGIDGPSGSGKSTLTRRLIDRTNATLVEIDDFVSWSDISGWWPRFDRQVLQPLLRGDDAHYQVRDWTNDPFGSSLDGWKRAKWTPLIIFDGVTSTRRAIAPDLAYRIWVEAPDDVRLARGLERDGQKARTRWVDWMQIEEEYFLADRARDRADLLIDGSKSGDPNSDTDVFTTIDRS